jgi:hypothetical protein
MEFNFQKVVLFVAIVVFIITLIFIATILYNNKYEIAFPPTISQCPDYWKNQQSPPGPGGNSTGASTDTNTQVCVNVKNLGNISCDKTKDFSGSFWQGSTGECNKYKWAKTCDLTWDGITNKPDICSITTSS